MQGCSDLCDIFDRDNGGLSVVGDLYSGVIVLPAIGYTLTVALAEDTAPLVDMLLVCIHHYPLDLVTLGIHSDCDIGVDAHYRTLVGVSARAFIGNVLFDVADGFFEKHFLYG